MINKNYRKNNITTCCNAEYEDVRTDEIKLCQNLGCKRERNEKFIAFL